MPLSVSYSVITPSGTLKTQPRNGSVTKNAHGDDRYPSVGDMNETEGSAANVVVMRFCVYTLRGQRCLGCTRGGFTVTQAIRHVWVPAQPVS